MKLSCHIKEFLKDDSGASAIEYAIILLLISVASVGAFTVAGNSLDASLTNTAAQIPG